MIYGVIKKTESWSLLRLLIAGESFWNHCTTLQFSSIISGWEATGLIRLQLKTYGATFFSGIFDRGNNPLILVVDFCINFNLILRLYTLWTTIFSTLPAVGADVLRFISSFGEIRVALWLAIHLFSFIYNYVLFCLSNNVTLTQLIGCSYVGVCIFEIVFWCIIVSEHLTGTFFANIRKVLSFFDSTRKSDTRKMIPFLAFFALWVIH